VKIWEGHLKRLQNVIENAKQQRIGITQPDQQVFDAESLAEIMGDYRGTIDECKRVLNKAKPSAGRSGGMNQLDYNLRIQPEVDRLTARIKVFNSKLGFLLKPLEIDLLQHISTKVDAIHEIVLRLHGLYIGELTDETTQLGQAVRFLDVPDDIRATFQARSLVNKPATNDSSPFPLAEATDVLVKHFANATKSFNPADDALAAERTATPKQYLNLLKSVWILRQLDHHPRLQKKEYSHWPSFIRHLSSEISEQCVRFMTPNVKLLRPTALNLAAEEYDIWDKPVHISIGPVIDENIGMMEEVQYVRMAPPQPDVELKMRVLRGAGERFKLMFTARDSANGGTRSERHSMEFCAKTVQLIPLYAHPSTAEDHELTIQLRSEFATTNLVFMRLDHLLRFQQAVTGFKAYRGYSHGPVDVALVSPARPVQRGKAFVQLWIPKELRGSVVSMDSIREETEQQERLAQSLPRSPSWKETSERLLGATANFPSLSSPRRPRPKARDSLVFGSGSTSPTSPSSSRKNFFPSSTTLLSRRGSTQSSGLHALESHTWGSKRQSISRSSSSDNSLRPSIAPTVTTINHGSGYGLIHTKPRKPMLVLFLTTADKQQPEKTSFITIELDDATSPNVSRCECQRNLSCPDIAIERTQGKDDLLTQRYDVEDLSQWDLTRLDIAKRKALPKDSTSKLQRVALRFHDHGGRSGSDLRREFGGIRCECKNITTSQLFNCLSAEPTHQGLYGDVKEIGRQALVNYHKAQNEAVDVVTGHYPMPPGS
jgi:hypothetical protein